MTWPGLVPADHVPCPSRGRARAEPGTDSGPHPLGPPEERKSKSGAGADVQRFVPAVVDCHFYGFQVHAPMFVTIKTSLRCLNPHDLCLCLICVGAAILDIPLLCAPRDGAGARAAEGQAAAAQGGKLRVWGRLSPSSPTSLSLAFPYAGPPPVAWYRHSINLTRSEGVGIGKDCAQDHACPVPPQGPAPEQSPGLTQGHIPSARGRRLASPRAFMGPLSTSLRHPSLVSRRGSMTLGWDGAGVILGAIFADPHTFTPC